MKNIEGKNDLLLGINIDKYFMPSVANIVGTDLTRYKVVKRNQFACNRMHVGRDYRIPMALSNRENPFIVSPAYTVFEIKDESQLLPEYLMMWFSRPEFDRECWFHTDADVRGGLPWDLFCDIELPIPSIEKQREIVNEYNTITNCIALNQQLNQKLEETAQTLYKHWFVDFEFPDKHGNPYNSSGGAMVYNEELDKEIPIGWTVGVLKSFSDIKGGKRMPSGWYLTSEKNNHPYIKVADLGTKKFALLNDKFEYVPNEIQPKISRYIIYEGDLIISIVGTIGIIKIINKSLNGANLTENCIKITNLTKLSSSYLYHYFMSNKGQNEIAVRNVGAVQAKLPMYNIETFPITCPSADIFEKFNKASNTIDNKIQKLQEEEVVLIRIKNLLLSKMTKVEVEEKIV